MIARREFLGAIGLSPVVASLTLEPRGMARARKALRSFAKRPGTPEEFAENEDFWGEVQRAFTVDRTILNLNNGGVSPALGLVQAAMKRHLDFSHMAPVYNMWRVLEPRKEVVRKQLADLFGCDAEEIAITRNASEGLQICQFGFDLNPGDEVLTTDQDYPRMITTWKQMERRRGVVLRQFPLPVPAEDEDEIVTLFQRHITDRTRLILMCHMINLTGQILPVRKVVQMARRRSVPVIVDGAHSFGHLDFKLADLDCDYFATSLHKWLFAPHGTGMLFVKRERIRDLWPLMAATREQDADIRKFEEIGTHPAANFLAIGEAATFQEEIGAARKEARLRYLRDYWAKRLLRNHRVKLNTSLDPKFSCGLANMRIEGVDSAALTSHLWQKHRILVTTIKHPQFEGIRVTPSVYTTLPELDRFCEAIDTVLDRGIPKT